MRIGWSPSAAREGWGWFDQADAYEVVGSPSAWRSPASRRRSLAPAGAGAAEPTASAPDGPPVTAIITYTHQPGAAEKQAIKALGGSVRRGVGLINGLVVTLPSNILAKARLGKNVKTVERDATITAFEPIDSAASTGDFEYDNAWGVAHIGAKAVHDAGDHGRRRQGRGHRHRHRLHP